MEHVDMKIVQMYDDDPHRWKH